MMHGITANRKSKEAGEKNEQLGLHKSFLQKTLTRAIFLSALGPNRLGKSQIPIGCMNWQHAVILESICETNSIILSLPIYRTGFLTPVLTSFNLLSSLLGQIIFSPTPFLPFSPLHKIILSSIPLLFSALLGQKNLSATPIPRKYSKTILSSVLAANSFHFYKSILSPTFLLTYKNSLLLLTYSIHLPLESKQCPLTPASVLACADSVDEHRF